MKTAWIVLVCLGGVCLGGCASGGTRSVQVVVEGNGPFPTALAGRWQSNLDGWQFVIEPDGSISSAIISFGRVEVKPGQITTAPALAGGKAIFEPGQWVVHYSPDTSDLIVKITMDRVHIETGDNILDGRSTDTFIGRVSPQEDLWVVQWTTFSHYTAHTTEKPLTEFATDPDKGETKPLVFRRVKPAS